MVSSRPRIPRILKIYTQVLQFAQESIPKNSFATALLLNSFMDWISLKGWGLRTKLGKQSAIWGNLGTALQAYALNPCTKFPPNPTSRKVNT